MESADETSEGLEMPAVMVGNHTDVAVDIVLFVSQIDCHCQWQFVNNCVLILNCLYGVVGNQ